MSMTIQRRRLFELAVHVKLASEAVMAAARHLSLLEPDASAAQAVAWAQTRDDLIAMNLELGSIERIVRATARGRIGTGGAGSALLRTASRGRL